MPANWGGARRIRRRRTTFRRKRVATVVPKATKAYVKKAITATKEMNHLLIDNSAQNIGYDTPLIAQWSTVTQGDTIANREGDRIQPRKLELNFRINLRSVQQVARIIVFQWRNDTADTTPIMGDILQVPGASNSYLSPYVTDVAKRQQFHVLKDMTFSNSNGEVEQFFVRKVNITKFMNKYINFNRGVTTGKSNIFVLAFSNVIATGPGPAFDKIVHLYWKDTA